MNRGYFVFAQGQEYIRLAYALALSIKNTQTINQVCVAIGQNDEMPNVENNETSNFQNLETTNLDNNEMLNFEDDKITNLENYTTTNIEKNE